MLGKQILVDRLLEGAGAPTNHWVPRGMPGYSVGLKNPPPDGTQSVTGNQTAAADLLKKAKDSCPASGIFTDKKYDYCRYIAGKAPLDLTLNYRAGHPTDQTLATGIANQWNSLGLNVKTVGLDGKQFFGNMGPGAAGAAQNPMQMWMLGWIADYSDPQDWLSLFIRSGALYNWNGASDPTIDKLLDAADQEQNFDKRMTMYNQAEQWAVDNIAMVPIEQAKFSWRERPWVSGFALTPLQLMIDTDWQNVVILAH
jgi:ABC-type transport system substrate-binding protein